MKKGHDAYPLRTELGTSGNIYLTIQDCSTEDGNVIIFIVNQDTNGRTDDDRIIVRLQSYGDGNFVCARSSQQGKAWK